MQPPSPQFPQFPQFPQPFIRRYTTDAEYTSDAQQLTTSGWRVSSLYREPTGTIVATYAPYVATAHASPRPGVHPAVIVVGVIGLVIVLCCFAPFLATVLSSAHNQSITLTPTDTPEPTFAPYVAPTASPAPMIAGAHLGGPLSAFDAVYGPEASQGTWNTTIAGVPVQIMAMSTRAGESVDGQDRVIVISIRQLHGSNWTPAQDDAIVRGLLPLDASLTQTQPGSGDPTGSGPEHIYMSQQLAASVAPSVFVDVHNQPVTPGTFDWQCTNGDSGTQSFCIMGAGTN